MALGPLNMLSSEVTSALTDPAMGSSTMSTRHLVIVVDDDPSLLRAVQRVLQVHGFETEVFSSVEGFFEGAHLGDATCLVLDIHLQHISGIELRRQLTRSGHSVPVIFITAVESEATHKAALEAGCVAYLHKPFPSDRLIEAIETIIEKGSER
jgi:FixJ family two-component response regulator